MVRVVRKELGARVDTLAPALRPVYEEKLHASIRIKSFENSVSIPRIRTNFLSRSMLRNADIDGEPAILHVTVLSPI